MLGEGDVLSMGSAQRLHHLDAEAGTVSEEHSELGHGGESWHRDADLWMRVAQVGRELLCHPRTWA